MGRPHAVVLVTILASTACTALLGVDFEGRLAPSDLQGDGGGGTIDGRVPDGDVIGDDGGPSDVAAQADAFFSLAWSRWGTSGLFPADESFVADQEKVTDAVTGLVWARAPLPTGLTWPSADTLCRTSTLGGFSDWRLPTRIELLSTVPYEQANQLAVFSPLFDRAWTASPSTPNMYWTIAPNGAVVFEAMSAALTGRCVRAGRIAANAPPTRWVVTADTVEDTITHLLWERTDTIEGLHGEATGHCASLSLGGSIGARVPTLQELYTIMDERVPGGTALAVDPVFMSGDSKTNRTWTTTTQGPAVQLRWVLDRTTGATSVVDISLVDDPPRASVRCVR